MFEIIKADVRRYPLGLLEENRGIFKKIQAYLMTFGLQATVVFRYGQWVKRRFTHSLGLPLKMLLWLTYRLLDWIVKGLYDIHLSSKAEIGPGLKIGHFGGIRIGQCRLGKNCSIQQHVKIGVEDAAKGKGPAIGSYVWIGAHSKIVGNIAVDDRATISAGAIVDKDVAGRCLVLGNPARVINKDYDNSKILDATF